MNEGSDMSIVRVCVTCKHTVDIDSFDVVHGMCNECSEDIPEKKTNYTGGVGKPSLKQFERKIVEEICSQLSIPPHLIDVKPKN